MSTHYRIYCLDPSEEGWQYTWSETAPTVCPNNVEHAVNLQSVQELESAVEILRIPIHSTTKSSNFQRLAHFQYNPIANGVLRSARCIAYTSRAGDTFTIQIFDATHNQILASFTSGNTTESILQMGTLSNVPTASCVLEVSLKRNGGTATVTIDEIVFYA